jgi:HbrB-like
MNPASTSQIDVRSVALKSFRDRVILPPFQRLFARLSLPNRQDSFQEAFSYQQPRLQQMYMIPFQLNIFADESITGF